MTSKRELRRQKRAMKAKEEKRNSIIVLCIGLFFLILGIIGIVISINNYNEYNNSSKIMTVEGIVTYVEIKTGYDKSKNEKYDYWEANLNVEIDGQEYEFIKYLNYEVRKDDTVKFEVYKKSDGTYEIPESKSKVDLFYNQIIYYISIVVGGLLVVGSIFYFFTICKENRDLRVKDISE